MSEEKQTYWTGLLAQITEEEASLSNVPQQDNVWGRITREQVKAAIASNAGPDSYPYVKENAQLYIAGLQAKTRAQQLDGQSAQPIVSSQEAELTSGAEAPPSEQKAPASSQGMAHDSTSAQLEIPAQPAPIPAARQTLASPKDMAQLKHHSLAQPRMAELVGHELESDVFEAYDALKKAYRTHSPNSPIPLTHTIGQRLIDLIQASRHRQDPLAKASGELSAALYIALSRYEQACIADSLALSQQLICADTLRELANGKLMPTLYLARCQYETACVSGDQNQISACKEIVRELEAPDAEGVAPHTSAIMPRILTLLKFDSIDSAIEHIGATTAERRPAPSSNRSSASFWRSCCGQNDRVEFQEARTQLGVAQQETSSPSPQVMQD